MVKTMPSWLRYPGGKAHALKIMRPLIPETMTEYREPFLGGASIFLNLLQSEAAKRYWINDINPELATHFQVAMDHLKALTERLWEIKREHKDGRELFRMYKDCDVNTLTEIERAARFFVLNRITFSGTIESGGYSQQAFDKRFTLSSIGRLYGLAPAMKFPNVHITCDDYEPMLTCAGDDVFIYLDPPYMSAAGIYGINGHLQKFDHGRLSGLLRSCEHPWLMTYDDVEGIRDLYTWAQVRPWTKRYGMNNIGGKACAPGQELFISNRPFAV